MLALAGLALLTLRGTNVRGGGLLILAVALLWPTDIRTVSLDGILVTITRPHLGSPTGRATVICPR